MSSNQSPVLNHRVRSRWLTPLLIFGFLVSLYYTTAPKTSWSHDPLTNTITAWKLGTAGTVVLTEHAQLLDPSTPGGVVGVVPGRKGPVSIYPIGTALHVAPLYALLDSPLIGATIATTTRAIEIGVPPIWPGVAAASATTAAAMAVLFVTLRRLGTDRAALAGTTVSALATGAWSVSSQALWQHGPAMVWTAVAILCLHQVRPLGAFAWMTATLVRPHVALMSMTAQAFQAIKTRSPALLVPAIGAVAGLGLLTWFSWTHFGEVSPVAGYAGASTIRIPDTNVARWIGNVAGALLHPRRGLILSPFLILLIPGLRAAWRAAPVWVRGAALGGVAYFLVQYNVHDFYGGDRYFGYRYQLESLIAWAPLLFVSYLSWVKGSVFRERLFWISVAVGIGLQIVGVMHPYNF